MSGLQISTSPALLERRLTQALGSDPVKAQAARAALERALAQGNVELAGAGADALPSFVTARTRVPAGAPLTRAALLAWHGALVGPATGFRRAPREGGAPPEWIEGRLELLESWMAEPSGLELSAGRAAALVLARLTEIAPFVAANGCVARLAAAHEMERRGARPPVLLGADAPRLAVALSQAQAFDTQPLVALLEEASDRALTVMLAALV